MQLTQLCVEFALGVQPFGHQALPRVYQPPLQEHASALSGRAVSSSMRNSRADQMVAESLASSNGLASLAALLTCTAVPAHRIRSVQFAALRGAGWLQSIYWQ